jgi:hypothetical protein
MAPKEQERRRWHFKKELSLGDLIAVAGAAASVLWAYTNLDKRMTLVEAALSVQRAVDTRQDDEAMRYQARIDEALREINRKLDRLIERGAPRVP